MMARDCIRVSIRQIPRWQVVCTVENPCPYRDNGLCDEPRINKGNSDAACHLMLNKDLLPMLTEQQQEG